MEDGTLPFCQLKWELLVICIYRLFHEIDNYKLLATRQDCINLPKTAILTVH